MIVSSAKFPYPGGEAARVQKYESGARFLLARNWSSGRCAHRSVGRSHWLLALVLHLEPIRGGLAAAALFDFAEPAPWMRVLRGEAAT